MGKIELAGVDAVVGSGYPSPYGEPCSSRQRWRLGEQAGLTQFGVNLLKLPPGAWSSQRHWHSAEDEFVYVVQGEVVLVTEAGEEVLRAGDCAGFKAGEPLAHHLQNRSTAEAVLLEVGTRDPGRDAVSYPDIDLQLPSGALRFCHKDGTASPPRSR